MTPRPDEARRDRRVLVSHVGVSTGAPGAVVLDLPDGRAPDDVRLVPQDGTMPVALVAGPVEHVARWSVGPFSRVPLPDRLATGTYVVELRFEGEPVVRSLPFSVAPDRVQRETMSDVLAYFRAMRSSGEIDRKDRAARRWGETDGPTVDARGGWLDASGDTSKFLSHLTYTRTMSPQQTPLCAWAFLAARDMLRETHPQVVRSVGNRLRDEALWGADFLVRFQAPEGYFYTGIFDALTKELDERVVTAPIQDSVRTDRYQAAYRHGGGLAIAALARASTTDDDGDLTRAQYLQAAVRGFEHLEQHNLEYLWDGRETVVDDYCALLAAAELVAAGHEAALRAARRRAAALAARHVRPMEGPGWLRADDEGRPFFHAAEAGLPALALLRFAQVVLERDASGRRLHAALLADARAAQLLAQELVRDLVARTDATPNAFGYPRQRVQAVGGTPQDAFFFPHENETGYWWQGESATIASLAAAAAACLHADPDVEDAPRLRTFVADQLAWILGRNPFDTCLLQGRGRGNVEYASDFPNLPGGIVNGITAGWQDEEDVAFLPRDAPEGDSWRWAEQWIPHTAWFLLAVASAP